MNNTVDIEDMHLALKCDNTSMNNIIQSCNENHDNKPFTTYDKGLPSTHKVFINTWGCSHNKSDSEYIAGVLLKEGYELIDENRKYDADVWVLNGCTVKDPSELSFDKNINLAKKNGIKLVLAGCVTQADSKKYTDYSIIGIHELDRVGEAVEETLKGYTVKYMKRKRKDGGNSLSLPKVRMNKFIEIIPINTGCLNNCTYCKTKLARSGLNSYKEDEIIERVKTVISEGVVEIWLTSEDTGTYGRDIGTNIVNLLWKIVKLLPDHVMLRLGMTNPPYIMEHKEEISKILNHPRVYAFLHIPVQSGSNKILEIMKREYTREEFIELVDYLTKHVKHIHIATDVICGFPYENDTDFQDTCELIKMYRFQTLNISQFYPRKGTPAAKMGQINSFEKKRRSRIIAELFGIYKDYYKFENQIFKVLCTDVSHRNNYYVAHNKYFHQILIPQKEEYMGKMLYVKINKTDKFYMIGEVIDYIDDYNSIAYIIVVIVILILIISYIFTN